MANFKRKLAPICGCLVFISIGLQSGGSEAGIPVPLEQRCYEDFHANAGLKWKNAVLRDNDSGIDIMSCKPFVSRDFLTWLGSKSENSSTNIASSTTNGASEEWGWCVTDSSSTVFQSRRKNCYPPQGFFYLNKTYALKEKESRNKQPATSIASNTKLRDGWGWCVSDSSEDVFEAMRVTCHDYWKGSAFYLDRSAAENEKKRRNKNSSTNIASSTTNGASEEWGWCVTDSTEDVLRPKQVTCDTYTKNSAFFLDRSTAENEKKRRNENSSTSIAASTTNQSLDKTLDLEFWKSIKDSGDKDKFIAYINKFPDGVYADLARIEIKALGGSKTSKSSSIPKLDYGVYRALVIGNNNYPHLGDLRTAVNDARVVADTLEKDYGFTVNRLFNADREQILQAVQSLRQSSSKKDNVLIYYAGHGILDEAAEEGYWLPVDARRDDQSNWLLTDRVVGQIRGMEAKHVMVVADSCFSGTLTRAINIQPRSPEWISQIVDKKARIALTSGGLEPVTDAGGGSHSAFARAFISILQGNDGVLDTAEMFTRLRPKVIANSSQTPQYGVIHRAGDDGGDFLFVRKPQ